MKIKWTIEKQRGNFRPVLEYDIVLEDFEIELALPSVKIVSDIACIPDPKCKFCLPHSNEREAHWQADKYHNMYSPDCRKGKINKRIILPFTIINDFKLIENSFIRLREAFEKEMQAAKDSESILIRQHLSLSDDVRNNMAAGIAAHKLLQFARV